MLLKKVSKPVRAGFSRKRVELKASLKKFKLSS
jgi:hypothetical protein